MQASIIYMQHGQFLITSKWFKHILTLQSDSSLRETKGNQKQPPKLWEEKPPVLSVWAQGFLVTPFNQSCLPRMFSLHSLRSQHGWHPEVKANSTDSKTAQPLEILHSRSFIWKPLKEGRETRTIEAWLGKNEQQVVGSERLWLATLISFC